MTRSTKIEAALLAREWIRRACEASLYEFARRFWHVVEPATAFVPGWHLEAICVHLEAITLGSKRSPDRLPFRRFVLNEPPRHMKSLLVGVFWPCWVWTFRPEARWIFASYAGAFAVRDQRKCRAVLSSRLYRWLWPGVVELTKDAEARFENGAGGHRIATSPEGVGTGEGGDYIVVDDAHRAQDASSETKRRAVLEWWDGSMSTRGNNPETAVFAVVGQRVHEEDLSGHLLARGAYRALILPAEYDGEDRSTTGLYRDPRTEHGELLWPERFTRRAIEDLKTSMGSYVAAAQLQQRPAPKGGGIVKREWWRTYEALPAEFDERLVSWDMAFNDQPISFVCGQAWGRIGARYYLIDLAIGRWGFTATCAAVVDFHGKHPDILLTLIEHRANGAAVIATLREKVPGLVPVEPDGSKLARAQAVSPLIEAGNVYLPHSSIAPWIGDFKLEWEQFPFGARNDQVDTASQALRRLSLPSLAPIGRVGGLLRPDLGVDVLAQFGSGRGGLL